MSRPLSQDTLRLSSALLDELKRNPIGLTKDDIKQMFGIIRNQLRNVLAVLDKNGHGTHKDRFGGVYLLAAREEMREKARAQRVAEVDRRRGKLLNARTYM